MGYNEEVHYQSRLRMINQKSIQQCNQHSLTKWIYWRVVQDKCWSETRVPTIPMLVNVFLERIITGALDGHVCTVSIGERQLTKMSFADDRHICRQRNSASLTSEQIRKSTE